MSYIKTICFASIITFTIIVFITSDKLRGKIFEVLNHKIGNSKIKIIDLFVIIISIIIILYSFKLLLKAKKFLHFWIRAK